VVERLAEGLKGERLAKAIRQELDRIKKRKVKKVPGRHSSMA
jgi:hypothetical protein